MSRTNCKGQRPHIASATAEPEGVVAEAESRGVEHPSNVFLCINTRISLEIRTNMFMLLLSDNTKVAEIGL